MLISIVLTLVAAKEVTLPAFVGRANYAATLAQLGRVDAALAERIHQSDGPKPLTCSSLMGVHGGASGVTVGANTAVYVRMTGLTPEVSARLADALLSTPPTTWELGGEEFAVLEAICDPTRHGWSGQTTYEALAAAQLTRVDALDRQVTLEFAAPTAFKSKEMTVPVPLPGLVFGSLVERWNAFSPVVLSPEMRRYGEEVMAISRYRLESRAVGQKGDGLRIGGVGTVTYRALASDRYWLGVMHMLAEFALYGGVGVQTATGMGQARRIAK
ncbi:MAG TPA: CRISPR system precrRNA processing endoribonuclease RAMP protein Cas6 [Chloroflexi bacterium]|nr:CRISPR system precrRNA processing endoribonuclease RAMP protein Cas6 [Chloroflexota bacterium]